MVITRRRFLNSAALGGLAFGLTLWGCRNQSSEAFDPLQGGVAPLAIARPKRESCRGRTTSAPWAMVALARPGERTAMRLRCTRWTKRWR